MSFLLDTNALINLMMPMIPESHAAMREVLVLSQQRGVALLVAASSVLDASWIIVNGVASKKLLPDKAARVELARRMREAALSLMDILPVDEDILRAAEADGAEEDFEDAVVAAAGANAGATYVVSDDIMAFNAAAMVKLGPVEAARVLCELRS